MPFEISSPCRKCPQMYGSKDVCVAYCPALHDFKVGLMEYTRHNVGCFLKEYDAGDLPLDVEIENDLFQKLEKDGIDMAEHEIND